MHDDFLVQAGLRATLSSCPDLLVEAADGEPADILVTDFHAGVRRLCAGGVAASRVMIVAREGREWQIREALRRGAAAYVALDTTADELVDAVRTIHAGGSYLSPLVLSRLAESLAAPPLTAREEQVLSLIVDGLGNKHIAIRLNISLGTVKTHVRSLFEKLEVRSRIAAVAATDRRGLVRPAAAAQPRAAACQRSALTR